ncbi:MAG TPA: PAC2 family protein [Dehalococcoidales bacterium]
MATDYLTWYEKPVLSRPHIIMGFTGWSNAGEVASSVLWYLLSRYEVSLFAELKTDDFYSYESNSGVNKRPLVDIENGMIHSYSAVTTNFWFHRDPLSGHDLMFISGPEPDQGWNRYSGLILDLAQEYQAEKIVTLGGTFDSIPHTAPPRISGVVSHTELKEELEKSGIEPTSYKGPSSIHTLLMVNAAKRDLRMISLWSHTPHYIQVVNFIGCYQIMLKLSELLNIKFDLEVARKDSEYLKTQIDQAIEKKPELQEYLKTLEIEYHKGSAEVEGPINNGILKEIDEIFKEKKE